MAPPTFIIHRVVLWIAQHIVVSFSLDADFFLVAWDGVGSVVLVKKTEKMWRKTLRMLSSVTLYCHFVMTDYDYVIYRDAKSGRYICAIFFSWC